MSHSLNWILDELRAHTSNRVAQLRHDDRGEGVISASIAALG